MRIVSVNHAAVTSQAMGGEVSMHRQLVALARSGHEVIVLAERGVEEPHFYEGVRIQALTDLGKQLMDLEPEVVIGFHEQAISASLAAVGQGIQSITRMDAPPRYARHLMPAVLASDAVIYNTTVAAREWGEGGALVIHPPMPDPPTAIVSSKPGDPYLATSNLVNKGIAIVLELAARMPDQPFLVMRSPCEPTHGLDGFNARVAKLPNVTVLDRVKPHEMPTIYDMCRMVLVPSRYETYGMAGLEGLAHGRPCVHVDTPHAFEGVGSDFCVPSKLEAVASRIALIEKDYDGWSDLALKRADRVRIRQEDELEYLGEWMALNHRHDPHKKSQRRAQIRRRVGIVR